MNNIFNNRTVLVTGHTGFKGSWLSLWLTELGANVVGYALEPRTQNDNYIVSKLHKYIYSEIGDIRDYDNLKRVMVIYRPEIVFHLAAQPIVRLSYEQPEYTYDVNVNGTINLLNCCLADSVRVVINVTTDKCYLVSQLELGRPYKEDDILGGNDPYSKSKVQSEIVTATYKTLNVSTVRAGNVIGGGDWQVDRIIPDCIRALKDRMPIGLRNPSYTRPYQFVLEPLYGYLLLASKMWDGDYKGAWNFAPEQSITTEQLAKLVIIAWGRGTYTNLSLQNPPHESSYLALDATKAKTQLGWQSVFSIEEAVYLTVEGYKKPSFKLCLGQINQYYDRITND